MRRTQGQRARRVKGGCSWGRGDGHDYLQSWWYKIGRGGRAACEAKAAARWVQATCDTCSQRWACPWPVHCTKQQWQHTPPPPAARPRQRQAAACPRPLAVPAPPATRSQVRARASAVRVNGERAAARQDWRARRSLCCLSRKPAMLHRAFTPTTRRQENTHPSRLLA
jgi:hypothetical protein